MAKISNNATGGGAAAFGSSPLCWGGRLAEETDVKVDNVAMVAEAMAVVVKAAESQL